MSWKSGSELMEIIVRAAKRAIPDDKVRYAFYKKVYAGFIDMDWDSECEFIGSDPALDRVIKADMKRCGSTREEIAELFPVKKEKKR